MKDKIEGTIKDLVAAFLYYDRKEDEELPEGVIDEAVRRGEISVDDMVEAFRRALVEGLR